MPNGQQKETHIKENYYLVRWYWLVFIVIFIGIFIFFTQAHPLYIYDTDDWYNTGYMRRALPIWGYFNPTKVLPEVSMSLCADIAAFIVMPFTKDYILSLSLVDALFVSCCIALYGLMFFRMLVHKYLNTPFAAGSLTGIFMLFHFLIFKNATYDNLHLFYAINVTCYFNYIIPALFNAIAVLYFMGCDSQYMESALRPGRSYAKNGFVLLMVYLSLFSSIFYSIILSVYAGVQIISALIRSNKNQKHFVHNTIRKNMLWTVIVFMWLVSLVFEASGGRTKDISISYSQYTDELFKSVGYIRNMILNSNRMLLFLIAVFTVLGVVEYIHCVKKKFERTDDFVIGDFICSVITIVYLVLLSGKAGSVYISRPEMMFAMLLYIFIFVFKLFAFYLEHHSYFISLLPLLVFIVFIQTINGSKSYKDVTYKGISIQTTVQVDNAIIEQFRAADQSNITEFDLHVPANNSKDAKWPFADYSGTLIADTLYRHGIISRPMKVTVVQDESMNRLYHVKYTD